jgi:hypothetical protein
VFAPRKQHRQLWWGQEQETNTAADLYRSNAWYEVSSARHIYACCLQPLYTSRNTTQTNPTHWLYPQGGCGLAGGSGRCQLHLNGCTCRGQLLPQSHLGHTQGTGSSMCVINVSVLCWIRTSGPTSEQVHL